MSLLWYNNEGNQFQDDIPSITIGMFKDHNVPLLDLISLQGATENCHNPELVEEPLRLVPNLFFL